jgi:hypothetical protein
LERLERGKFIEVFFKSGLSSSWTGCPDEFLKYSPKNSFVDKKYYVSLPWKK